MHWLLSLILNNYHVLYFEISSRNLKIIKLNICTWFILLCTVWTLLLYGIYCFQVINWFNAKIVLIGPRPSFK